jgi:hypothetical protein
MSDTSVTFNFNGRDHSIRPLVAKMAVVMEERFAANDHKNEALPLNETVLMAKLMEECSDLVYGVLKTNEFSSRTTLLRSADVANMASLIASHYFSNAPSVSDGIPESSKRRFTSGEEE